MCNLYYHDRFLKITFDAGVLVFFLELGMGDFNMGPLQEMGVALEVLLEVLLGVILAVLGVILAVLGVILAALVAEEALPGVPFSFPGVFLGVLGLFEITYKMMDFKGLHTTEPHFDADRLQPCVLAPSSNPPQDYLNTLVDSGSELVSWRGLTLLFLKYSNLKEQLPMVMMF